MSWWGDSAAAAPEADGALFSPGPLAGLDEVFGEAYREARVTTNLNAQQIAGELIYDDVIEEVRVATGENLQNPYRLSFRERYIDSFGPSLRSPYNPRQLAIEKAKRDFQLRYYKLQQSQFEQGVAYDRRLPDFNFEDRVRALVHERRAALADTADRAGGLDRLIGSLGGAFVATGTDPGAYAAAMIPVGASRTVLGVAVKGVIANASIEAALQPSIALWHRELGLEYSAKTAATNVVFAGLFGGALEGGGAALSRALFGSPEFRAAKKKLKALPEDHTLRQALSGKRRDVIAAARTLEAGLDPAGKAALAREEAALRAEENVPEGVAPDAHENALSAAEVAIARDLPPEGAARAAETARPELEPFMTEAAARTERGRQARHLARLSDEAYDMVREGALSPDQGAAIAARVADPELHAEIARDVASAGRLNGAQTAVAIGASLEARAALDAAAANGWAGPAPARPQSLIDWIRARGGVRDDRNFAGEVAQLLGGDPRARPGLINNRSGTELDMLARAAADDGFDIPGEDPARLLRAIEDELAGDPQYRIGDREVFEAYQEALAGPPDPASEVRAAVAALAGEADPDAPQLGRTLAEMIEAQDAPEAAVRAYEGPARAPEPAPARRDTDWRAEAEAIDALRTPEDARARIRAEAEEAFGEAAARVIADDPETEVSKPALFSKRQTEFVTTAEQALNNPPPRFRDAKALTPLQWRKYFRDAGVKGEAFEYQIEPALKALGRGDYDKITKEELARAMDEARPMIDTYSEIRKEGADGVRKIPFQLLPNTTLKGAQKRLNTMGERADDLRLKLDDIVPEGDTFLDQLRFFVKSSSAEGSLKALEKRMERHAARYRLDGRTTGFRERDYVDYISRGPHSNYKQELILLPDAAKGYKSHNWKSGGVVGHIRTTDRKTVDGRKVRFVDELQSDLHQEGAKYGYLSDKIVSEDPGIAYERHAKTYKDALKSLSDEELFRQYPDAGDPAGDPAKRRLAEAIILNNHGLLPRQNPGLAERAREFWAASDRLRSGREKRPPRAPMKDWEKPFIRRALQQAIADGHDTVAFTSHDALHTVLKNDGTRKFYDERLPAHIRKVAQELGAEVERVRIDGHGGDVLAIRITPEARAALKERGNAMFSKGGETGAQDLLQPLERAFIAEDSAALRSGLLEAAACASGNAFAPVAAVAAGGGLALAGAAAVEARHDEARAKDTAERARRRWEGSDEKAALDAERRAARHIAAVAAHRAEARDIHARRREQLRARYAADLSAMPDRLPQFRVNHWTQQITGVRADYLDALISHESSDDWGAQAATSSAAGGAQFIDSTWMRFMRKLGPSYGLKIDPKSAAARAEMLGLRNDARWGTVMAAEYAKENAAWLSRRLGRPITQKEAYLGHFLGDEAGALLTAEADALPETFLRRSTIEANLPVFFIGGDRERPRTAAQVIARQGRNFSADPLLAPDWTPPGAEIEEAA